MLKLITIRDVEEGRENHVFQSEVKARSARKGREETDERARAVSGIPMRQEYCSAHLRMVTFQC
jgi:hypothetical protein